MRPLWILFLLVLLTPICSFSQEESETGGAGSSIKKILEKGLPPNPDRVIKVDSKTGLIILRDTPTNQKMAAEILKDIDLPSPQITIEARFVDLNQTDLSELGINWGSSFRWYDYGPGTLSSRDAQTMISGGQNPGSLGNLITFPDTTTSGEGLYMQLSRLRPIELDIVIRALARNDKANLLSAPKITAINHEKARIDIVDTVPYISEATRTNTGTASDPIWTWDYTVAEEEVGIALVVTPTVGEGEKIINLQLEPEVEVLSCRLDWIDGIPESLGWPVIERRSLKTTVMLQSGETIVMGGLLDDRDDEVIQKVPILGDIPLLGNLFRHKYRRRVKRNLLIFVTASLINPEGEEIVD